MRNLFLRLWKDDEGVVTFEYIALVTLVGLGVMLALVSVEDAINVEGTELAESIMCLDQSWSYGFQSDCKFYRPGASAFDIRCPQKPYLVGSPIAFPNAFGVVDADPCPPSVL